MRITPPRHRSASAARTLLPQLLAVLLMAFGLVSCGDSPDPASPEEGERRRPVGRAPTAGDQEPPAWLGGPQNGRWVPPRGDGTVNQDDLTEEEQKEMDRLKGLGYIGGKHEGDGRKFVTLHSPDMSPGVTFLTPANAPKAYLIPSDWKGDPVKPLHVWRKSFREAFPGRPMPKIRKNVSYFRRTELLPGGDLIAIFEGNGIIRLDKDSNLIWASPVGAHHDLEVMPDGSVWVLTRAPNKQPAVDPDNPILEDFLTLLDPQGKVVRSVSILKAYHKSPWKPDWAAQRKNARGDVMHTNSLHRLDGSLADRIPEFQEGRFLLSTPMLDTIFVMDVETEEVVWAMQGEFAFQHDPQVLENGNLMVFDNVWQERTDPDRTKGSSVLEIDPVSKDIVWRYRGSKITPFYSETCGAAQRLPNGNTLITETDYGRAFEVNADGDLVWEFINPFRFVDEDGKELVACLMEAWRVPAEMSLDWLESR